MTREYINGQGTVASGEGVSCRMAAGRLALRVMAVTFCLALLLASLPAWAGSARYTRDKTKGGADAAQSAPVAKPVAASPPVLSASRLLSLAS